jgi:hypothetical protein
MKTVRHVLNFKELYDIIHNDSDNAIINVLKNNKYEDSDIVRIFVSRLPYDKKKLILENCFIADDADYNSCQNNYIQLKKIENINI